MRNDLLFAGAIGAALGGFFLLRGNRAHATEIAPGDYARASEGQGVTLPDTRGFRNNNPGNIEYNAANEWQGQTGTDGRYATFSSMEYGVRALGKLLNTYYTRHGLTTIRGIITRWAPNHENDTASYIASVASRTGIAPDDQFNLETARPAIVAAIIHHENGHSLPESTIRQGLSLI